MTTSDAYLFCGVGGSGMLPLAMVLRALGATVAGSDRSRDQGRTPEKFAFIEGQGIALSPQDGSGMTSANQTLVVSAAVEDDIPDVIVAKKLGAPIVTRAQLLARLANAAPHSVAVGGTSGKSTTTGMIGWVLAQAGQRPTIINGAVMKNFVTAEVPFASAAVGRPDLFVIEVDESDGSIAQFNPEVAVLNNVSVDHKTIEELRALFGAFITKGRCAVLNLDNAEVVELAKTLPVDHKLTYSLHDAAADFAASDLQPVGTDGISFTVRYGDAQETVKLQVPGAHNVSNALAALAAAKACGVDLATAARALESFTGIGRRLDVIGMASGVTVIDDFAHNPDKITASLTTLRQNYRRLTILFQPHGYGPLRLMHGEFVACFRDHLGPDDRLFVTDPLYLGGTTNKSYGSDAFVADLTAAGVKAYWTANRADALPLMGQGAAAGDALVVMGARDDSLTQFARQLLSTLG